MYGGCDINGQDAQEKHKRLHHIKPYAIKPEEEKVHRAMIPQAAILGNFRFAEIKAQESRRVSVHYKQRKLQQMIGDGRKNNRKYDFLCVPTILVSLKNVLNATETLCK